MLSRYPGLLAPTPNKHVKKNPLSIGSNVMKQNKSFAKRWGRLLDPRIVSECELNDGMGTSPSGWVMNDPREGLLVGSLFGKGSFPPATFSSAGFCNPIFLVFLEVPITVQPVCEISHRSNSFFFDC